MKPFEGKRYGKGQRVRPQIWNAQKKRQRAKGKGYRAKSDRNAAKMKTAARVARNKSAPRLNVTFMQTMYAHTNILYTINEHAPKYRLHTKNKARTNIDYIHT